MVYAFGIEIPLIEILFALGVIGVIVLLEIIIILAISAYQMKNVRELVEELLRKEIVSEKGQQIKEELIQHFGQGATFHEAASGLGAKLSKLFYNIYAWVKHVFHFHRIKNLFKRKKKEEKIEFDFSKKKE